MIIFDVDLNDNTDEITNTDISLAKDKRYLGREIVSIREKLIISNTERDFTNSHIQYTNNTNNIEYGSTCEDTKQIDLRIGINKRGRKKSIRFNTEVDVGYVITKKKHIVWKSKKKRNSIYKKHI